jgi:protein SCO1/2
MNKIALSAIAVIAIAITVVVTLFFGTTDTDYNDQAKSFADLGGDFTLMSKNGPISLSDYKGQVVVMYFGFLNCPDVCPNSMETVRSALKRLKEDQLQQTKAVLVSLDPKRDTPEILAEYSQYFHPNLIGVTGTKASIDKVTKQYGAYYNFTELKNSALEYVVEHSSRYYVIDQDGKLITAMRHSTTSNELYAQISELLEKG